MKCKKQRHYIKKILSNFGYLTCDSTYKLNTESMGESEYHFNKLQLKDISTLRMNNINNLNL